jgi:hypothetical protein
MRKMAIFVEGQTERIFIERLLIEIAGANGLRIESFKAEGGGRSGSRTLTSVRVLGASTSYTHFVLIVDCSTDNRVKSDIRDNYDNLVASGYTAILGIRDVYPDFVYTDIGSLRAGLSSGLKNTPVTVQFTLGVMEIESWFLAEYSHFPRLDAALTLQEIVSKLGFNPSTDDLQLRATPALDLHNAYQLVGYSYQKTRNQAQRTVNLLDYATLYLQTKKGFQDMDMLIDTIDGFLA